MCTLCHTILCFIGQHWLVRSKKSLIFKGVSHHVRYRASLPDVYFSLAFFFRALYLVYGFFFLRYKLIFFVLWLQKHQGNFSEGFSRTQVSALAVKNNLLVTGGFRGEIICKVIPTLNLLPCFRFPQANVVRFWCLFVCLGMQFLDRQGISYCCKSTHDDNGITNSLEIYENPRYFLFY